MFEYHIPCHAGRLHYQPSPLFVRGWGLLATRGLRVQGRLPQTRVCRASVVSLAAILLSAWPIPLLGSYTGVPLLATSSLTLVPQPSSLPRTFRHTKLTASVTACESSERAPQSAHYMDLPLPGTQHSPHCFPLLTYLSQLPGGCISIS